MDGPSTHSPSQTTALIVSIEPCLIALKLQTLQAGSVAGIAVDCILFPLDTIKTRIQSEAGFRSSGGFRRIYSGIASSIVGSAPNAALFFVSYEGSKKVLKPICPYDTVSQMTAASIGEIVACFVRVPVEVVKQRTQAKGGTSWCNLKRTLKLEGVGGMYRGYSSTIAREIPFSFLQFPLWEYLKMKVNGNSATPVEPWKATLCGAIAGGTSAFLTTPLDVAKTRVILAEKKSQMATIHIGEALKSIWNQEGLKGLFSGAIPRVLWISIGGAIFLGGYEKTVQLIEGSSA